MSSCLNTGENSSVNLNPMSKEEQFVSLINRLIGCISIALLLFGCF